MPRLNIAAFVIDWDETISQNDTLSLLADCSPAASAQWSQFTSSYLSDLEAFQEAWEAEHGSRDTVDKQLQFLSDLEEVEQRSISRIEASNVFQGVTKDAIARAAKQAVVREGFKDFAEVAGSCYILSVHWSVHFIASALPEACRAWHIAANELEFQDGKCTGKVSKSGPDAFRTGIDKQRWLQRFRKEKKGLVVYIGDSNTDLPALLEADIGIIFGNNQGLAATCDRLGLQVSDLSTVNDNPKGLFRAECWKEMQSLML